MPVNEFKNEIIFFYFFAFYFVHTFFWPTGCMGEKKKKVGLHGTSTIMGRMTGIDRPCEGSDLSDWFDVLSNWTSSTG